MRTGVFPPPTVPRELRPWWGVPVLLAVLLLSAASHMAQGQANQSADINGTIGADLGQAGGRFIEATGGGAEAEGESPLVFAGLVVLLVFMFLLFRWGQPMDFMFAFAVPFFFTMGIHGFMPAWTAIITGGFAVGLFALGVLRGLAGRG